MLKIQPHYGHEVVVAQYTGQDGQPVNFAVECMDCYEVLFDEEIGDN
jgi:hypothetical protein